jgi:uncharacterized protein YcbX
MTVGTIAQLWRYPVKSMGGEALQEARVTEATGILGDRAYALLDVATGRIASAKHPRHWGALLNHGARVVDREGERHPRVQITPSGGEPLHSDDPDIDRRLSAVVGRDVRLVQTPPQQATYDEYKPELDAGRGEPLAVGAPAGTFFDFAALHLVTTATLARLAELRPTSRFDIARFRPNLVIDTGPATGFVDNDWVGQELAIGAEVRAYIDFPCPRCVMTTLAQHDLPADPEILRTAADSNKQLFGLLAKRLPSVGIYATVVHGGTVRAGDPIRVVPASRLRRLGTYAYALRRAVTRR